MLCAENEIEFYSQKSFLTLGRESFPQLGLVLRIRIKSCALSQLFFLLFPKFMGYFCILQEFILL